MDRFFDDFPSFPQLHKWGGGDLAMDVYEEGNNVVAEMSLPGIDPEKIEVKVEGNYLRVYGAREETKEDKKKNYYSKEIRRGSFERAVRLPENVDEKNIKAEYKKGELKVVMPKLAIKESGKIKVEVKD